MEVNKILFENLRNLGIDKSFEDLDVDGNGVIDDKDKSLAVNSDIQNAITIALYAADDDAELVSTTKTGSQKDKYGINTTDTANFDNDVRNSKGTTYVVLGNTVGCGYCKKLSKAMSEQLNNLEGVANIYNMEWNDNRDLCWDIVKQGGIKGSVDFPQIAKFVDGQFVELVNDSREPEKAIQNMINGAGAANSVNNDNTDNTLTAAANNTKTTLSEEDKAKLDALRKELAQVEERITAISEEIKKLQEDNLKLQEEQEKILKEQEEAQAAADEANEKLTEEQAMLDTYTKEYDDYQNEIQDLNKEILREQERDENEFQEQMNIAVNSAINNYNKDEDGDFDAYFARKMDSVGFPTFAKLNALNGEATSLSSKAEEVLRNIMVKASDVNTAKIAADVANSALESVNTRLNSVNSEISSNNSKITSLNSELTSKETQRTDIKAQIDEIIPPVPGSGLSAKEVLSLISDVEKSYARDLGWNLQDCIIAMGKDGNFHIYNECCDYPLNDQYYLSSARAYYIKNGGDYHTEASMSAVPWGSGFLQKSDFEESPDMCDGQPIYRFNCVNDDWTDGEVCESRGCYQTCSPLSFDVDGNGVNTTKETVSYDIDGDGELDTVNNSAEWVLAFDKDGNGIAGENGSELFGNNTDLDGDGKADGYKDGFEALKALAKKEGLIGDGDNTLDEKDIELLSKKYGLTMTNGYAGEAKSLIDLGITEISLSQTDETTLEKNYDGRNNDIMRQEGATFKVNGETREYADIWNAKKDANEADNKVADAKIADVQPKWGKAPKAKTNIPNVSLNINTHGVVALQGEADLKGIKKKSINNVDAPPADILDEIIEIKEDEDV